MGKEKLKIAINSKTAGKFEKRFLNNRQHIVTKMVSIVGNSVMNKGFYPLEEIQNSFDQLHFLHAPNGHPKIGNELISAFHPLAVNAFNVGGIVRNPKMDGDKVINELWLDVEVANKTDDGKELIRRIENGEKVGVSTGLSAIKVPVIGNHDGMDYTWQATNLEFDHVAILLNEKAAGEHVGTALQNSDIQIVNWDNSPLSKTADIKETDEDSIVNKVIDKLKGIMTPVTNAVTTSSLHDSISDALRLQYPRDNFYTYIVTIFPTLYHVVYEVENKGEETKLFKRSYSVDQNDKISLNDDEVEVIKKVEYVEVNSNVSIINSDPEEDTGMGEAANKGDGDKPLNIENAVSLLEEKGFMVSNKEESKDIKFFIDNKDRIQSMLSKEDEEIKSLRDHLVANSDLTDEDVKEMSEPMLKKLSNQLIPQQDYSAAGGAIKNRDVAVANEDLHDSYSPNYDEGDK